MKPSVRNLLHGIITAFLTTARQAADAPDPCDPNAGLDPARGFGSVRKTVYYRQTGNSAPTLDPEFGIVFGTSYRGAADQDVTAVSVTGPTETINLTNLFGLFLGNRNFSTPAALESAFPAGNYTLDANGAGSATLALADASLLPVLQINNLTLLAQMDPTKDFTLNFSAFTGAGPNDSILIFIAAAQGEEQFTAPDICRNIALPNTATSVVIPANTFKPEQICRGFISFSRRSSHDTNVIPNTDVSAAVSAVTSFGFSTSLPSGEPRAPVWTGPIRNDNDTLTYTLHGDPGSTVVIETTTTLGSTWVPLSTLTLTNGLYPPLTDPRGERSRFYRARLQ